MKNTLKDQVLIFGCGGHSRSVADVILAISPTIQLYFVDENAEKAEKIFNFDVLNKRPSGSWPCFVAIGDNEKRREKTIELGEENLVSVVSGISYVSNRSTFGAGCFIGNFSHLGPDVVIGLNTIINTAAILEHEVKVGKYCHIGPNATVSGRCTIGDSVFVGVGATVKDSVSICSNVIIGAGAVVIKAITEPGTYIGCPARKIR